MALAASRTRLEHDMYLHARARPGLAAQVRSGTRRRAKPRGDPGLLRPDSPGCMTLVTSVVRLAVCRFAHRAGRLKVRQLPPDPGSRSQLEQIGRRSRRASKPREASIQARYGASFPVDLTC
jgi:hypothetical protein